MSVQAVTAVTKSPPVTASEKVEVENPLPGPIPQDLTASQSLNPDRFQFLNPAIQKLKEKFNRLIKTLESEPSPTDPQLEEKNKRRDKCLEALSYFPAVGTGITVFKEKDFSEKLKTTFDAAQKLTLLKKQKEFRVAAIIRTVLSVALAILLLAIATFTGGVSIPVGLGLMGAALAAGSGFVGYYTTLLHDSNKKIAPLEPPKPTPEVAVQEAAPVAT